MGRHIWPAKSAPRYNNASNSIRIVCVIDSAVIPNLSYLLTALSDFIVIAIDSVVIRKYKYVLTALSVSIESIMNGLTQN